MSDTGLLKPLPKKNKFLTRTLVILISATILSLLGGLSNPLPEKEPPKQYLEGSVKNGLFDIFTFFNVDHKGNTIPTLVVYEEDTNVKIIFEKIKIKENEGFLLSYKNGGILEENCIYFSDNANRPYCPNGPTDSNGKGYSVWNSLKSETLALLEEREIFDFDGLRYITPNP